MKRSQNIRPPAGAGKGNVKKAKNKNFKRERKRESEREKLYILSTQSINLYRIIFTINRFPYTAIHHWSFLCKHIVLCQVQTEAFYKRLLLSTSPCLYALLSCVGTTF